MPRSLKLARRAVGGVILVHVVALIPLLLAFRLRTLKAHKRIFLTVLLGIQLLAHASLPITLHELPGYGGAVIAVQAVSLVFEVSALWLLWATDDSKAWFTARPR
ncbi:hypothetical protein [Kribbella sp. NPDC051718]|uniref:hypothetical protein n=1 Tax=Kribbella sp. NPDC051718 TaxID=3155168 RepID=UPI0034268510